MNIILIKILLILYQMHATFAQQTTSASTQIVNIQEISIIDRLIVQTQQQQLIIAKINSTTILDNQAKWSPCSNVTLVGFEVIHLTNCLIVRCSNIIKIECIQQLNINKELNFTKEDLYDQLGNQSWMIYVTDEFVPLDSQPIMQSLLIWPYFQIYQQNNTINFCTLPDIVFDNQTNLTNNYYYKQFDCTRLFKFFDHQSIKWHSTPSQSVKVVKTFDETYIYIYGINLSKPDRIKSKKQVYSVSQINGEIILWAKDGIYRIEGNKIKKKEGFFNTTNQQYCMAPYNDKMMLMNSLGKIYSYQSGPGIGLQMIDYEYSKIFGMRGGYIRYSYNNLLKIQYNSLGKFAYTQDLTQVYSDLDIAPFYHAYYSSQIIFVNSTNNNATNIDNSSINNSSSIISQQIIMRQEQILISFPCGTGCQLCINQQICKVCQSGFEHNQQDSTCSQSLGMQASSSIFSFPYSAFAMKMVLMDVMEQFWFFQYHNVTYLHLQSIFAYIGSINRNKFIPIYIKQLFPTLYQEYLQARERIFLDKSNFSDSQFLSKQKQYTLFSYNTSKLYVFNYIISIVILIITRFLSFLTSQCAKIHKHFRRSQCFGAVVMVLIQPHIQFVSFMFFIQTFNMSMESFSDKGNLIFAVLIMFLSIFYAFASYIMFGIFYRTQKFGILYPGLPKNSLGVFLYILLTGGCRKIFLGSIQALYYNFSLQMILMLFLNTATILSIKLICDTKIQKYPVLLKKSMIFMILLFVSFGLMGSLGIIRQYLVDELQSIFLGCILIIVSFDFLILLSRSSFEIIYYIFQKCAKNSSKVANQSEIANSLKNIGSNRNKKQNPDTNISLIRKKQKQIQKY